MPETSHAEASSEAADEAVGNDRRRQLAAAAWILGWIGGPVPAVVIRLVAAREGWARRHATWAAAFWLVMWAYLITLLVVARDADLFAVLWIGSIVVALAVTIVGALSAARASRASVGA